MRASTVSRGNKASTASTDGVCVCPTSITRNGIASLGIFKLCLANNSFISAASAGASHATSANRSASSRNAGSTSGTRCASSNSDLHLQIVFGQQFLYQCGQRGRFPCNIGKPFGEFAQRGQHFWHKVRIE